MDKNNLKKVPKSKFPDCCFVCAHAFEYPSGLDCRIQRFPDLREIDDICDLFERDAKTKEKEKTP
jgi:hypothetical protein